MTSDLQSSVPDWLVEHPQLWPLFEQLGIDCSCGGKSLETACREAHLDPQRLLTHIRGLLEQRGDQDIV